MSKTLQKRAGASMTSSPERQPSTGWSSRIDELLEDETARLEWDNDFGYHVARNLQELRRFREMTQSQLAEASGSSQPRIALIESGDANVTIRLLSRLIKALRGRLRFTVEPAELTLPQLPRWWVWSDVLPDRAVWTSPQMLLHSRPSATALIAGWTSGHDKPEPTLFETITLTGSTGEPRPHGAPQEIKVAALPGET